jgi:O-antigen/teichoic acid export membrane protein
LIKISQQHRDLFFTFIGQLWRLTSGLITMLLIPLFLSPEQQGYWYLFSSISALSVFADLGFSNIILQFSAHEYAYLCFENGLLAGNEENLKKLGSFFRFVVKWISTICLIVFPIIYIIGVLFFIRDHTLGIYFLPWTIYAIGTLINFFNNSVLSFLEGLDKITEIQKIRFKVAVVNTCVIITVLVIRGNIYALAFGMIISSSYIFILLIGKFRNVLKQLLNISKYFTYSWRAEIVPLFLKYAISWACGYFTFQIYTPLMHYFHGPVYSGKVGISLALVQAIFSISYIWMYTIVPRMNMLISKKAWTALDAIFRKRLLLSLATYLLITIGLFFFLMIFANFWIIPKVISRFLPISSLMLLLPCYVMQLMIGSWALYLRGHKQEPYVLISIANALLIAITTYLAGRFLSYDLLFLGYFSNYIWSTPIFYIIFKKNREKWHVC